MLVKLTNLQDLSLGHNSLNEDERNRLFAKLKNEAIYTKPPKGRKSAIVRKK